MDLTVVPDNHIGAFVSYQRALRITVVYRICAPIFLAFCCGVLPGVLMAGIRKLLEAE